MTTSTEKTDGDKATKGAAKKGSAAKATVRVEVLTRIRVANERDEDGKPGRPQYVEEGEEHDMPIDEAEAAEARGVVKILESRKAREAAKA